MHLCFVELEKNNNMFILFCFFLLVFVGLSYYSSIVYCLTLFVEHHNIHSLSRALYFSVVIPSYLTYFPIMQLLLKLSAPSYPLDLEWYDSVIDKPFIQAHILCGAVLPPCSEWAVDIS